MSRHPSRGWNLFRSLFRKRRPAHLRRARLGIETLDARVTPAVIDAFTTTPAQLVTMTGPGTTVDAVSDDPAALIGGIREIQILNPDTYDINSQTRVVINNSANSLLQHSADEFGAQSIVTWDGVADGTLTPTGLGGIDLTADGSNGFLVTVVEDDLAVDLTFTIYTDDDNISQATIRLPGGIPFATPITFTIPFSEFGQVGSGGPASFTNVGAISLFIDGQTTVNNGLDLRLDLIGTGDVGPGAIDLSLTKDVDDLTPAIGQDVVYTITVTNSSGIDATGVSVTDSLPAGLTFVGAGTATGDYDPANGLWTIGTVLANTTVTLFVTATYGGPGTVTNVCEITTADQPDIDSTPGNGVPGEDDIASVTIGAVSDLIDLSLTKGVNDLAPTIGDDLIYTITVTNSSGNDATGVSVLDSLPAGLTFVTFATADGDYDPATGVWTIGIVAANTTATLTVAATFNGPGAVTNLCEIVTADQDDVDSTPGNGVPGEDDIASVTVTPTGAVVSSISGAVYLDADDNGLNNGTDPGIGGVIITLTGTTPAGTVAATTTTDDTGFYLFTGLPAGTYKLTETQPAGFDQRTNNVGSVGGTLVPVDMIDVIVLGAGVDATNYDFGEITPGTPTVDLSLTKAVNNAAPQIGQQIIYTIQVLNSSGTAATGVTVTDSLPAGLTFVTSSTATGSYSAATGIWTVGTVPANSTVTLTVTAVFNGPAAVTNVCEITTSDQPDPDSTPGNGVPGEDDQATVTVTPGGGGLSSIEGAVYVDLNGNGDNDFVEPGIGTVTITLTGTTNTGGTVNLVTVTDASGFYQFTGLQPGTYKLTETQPANFLQGTNNVGDFGGVVAPVDMIANIVLPGGVAATQYDFGEITVPGSTGVIFNQIFSFGPQDFAPAPDVIALSKLSFLASAPPGQGLAMLSTAVYVDGMYRSLFGRAADATGVQFWTSQLQAGLPRYAFVDILWNNQEHRALQVDRIYQSVLGRAADAGGRAFWASGMTQGLTEYDVMRALLASDECFTFRGGNNVGYIGGLYQSMFGRAADSEGLTYWVNLLSSGASREGVINFFLTTETTYLSVVSLSYVNYLRRPLDGAAQGAFLQFYQSGFFTPRVATQVVLSSDECFARATLRTQSGLATGGAS